MSPIGTTSCAARLPLYKIYFPLFCNYWSTILLLVFHYIVTHNIMSPYKHIKQWNSLKVKFYFWSDNFKNVYIVLQIQLGCAYGSTFIYLNVLYYKHLIVSFTRANSFNLIMGLIMPIIKKFKMNYKGWFFSFYN